MDEVNETTTKQKNHASNYIAMSLKAITFTTVSRDPAQSQGIYFLKRNYGYTVRTIYFLKNILLQYSFDNSACCLGKYIHRPNLFCRLSFGNYQLTLHELKLAALTVSIHKYSYTTVGMWTEGKKNKKKRHQKIWRRVKLKTHKLS